MMSFGLKNAPVVFSRVVFATFKEFSHKFLEVYLDDWNVFILLKYHIETLFIILGRCRKYHISLNLKKCIFYSPFDILLGHVECKQGLSVDPTKIVMIFNFPPPESMRQLRTTLGHIGY
jgi:hypothetical protein